MIIGFVSLTLVFLLCGLVYLISEIKLPTVKDPEVLKEYSFFLGKKAKAQGRKTMSTLDKKRIVTFAGASEWQDLDVLTLYAEFNRGLEN